MQTLTMQGPLAVIAAAVTPVVLISAVAILINGINTKYTSVADRLRLLTAEYRDMATARDRKENIRRQVPLFRRRLRLLRFADVGLYLSVAAFVAMVLVISLIPAQKHWETVTLPLFFAGCATLLFSVALEIAELSVASRTLSLECADVST